MTSSRVFKELQQFKKITDFKLLDYDASSIDVALTVLDDASVFFGANLSIKICMTPEYPLSPPKAYFVSKIFHPNVDFATGEICLDILKAEWSPAWGLQSVCTAIRCLISDPNPDSPLNCDAAALLRSGDKRAFECVARLYLIEGGYLS